MTCRPIPIGEAPARVAFASSSRLVVAMPGDLDGGRTPDQGLRRARRDGVRLDRREVGDGTSPGRQPGFRRAGQPVRHLQRSRGQEAPVSIFRVTREGTREPFVSGIVNATSMAFGPDGRSTCRAASRAPSTGSTTTASHEQVASDLGVACGIAFDQEAAMYVGDRSGTIFRVRDGQTHRVCHAPAERRRVSPGDERRAGTVRDGADAEHLRLRLPDRSARPGAHAAVAARPPAGAGVRARRRAARRRRAGRRERRLPVSRSRRAAGTGRVRRRARRRRVRSAGELVVRRTKRRTDSDMSVEIMSRGLLAPMWFLGNPADPHLFARKPIDDLQPPGDEAHSLKRVLGAGDLVMLAIGAVIGAGIFGAIGTAAAGQIGPYPLSHEFDML